MTMTADNVRRRSGGVVKADSYFTWYILLTITFLRTEFISWTNINIRLSATYFSQCVKSTGARVFETYTVHCEPKYLGGL